MRYSVFMTNIEIAVHEDPWHPRGLSGHCGLTCRSTSGLTEISPLNVPAVAENHSQSMTATLPSFE
jgi:hypothetical protein